MKYLSEYRSPELAEALLKEIKQIVSKDWNIMEVCGGQTHSPVKNGILNMLPPNIQMIHGPGCPVCVTPVSLIDKAIHLATEHNVILCSYGDMIRVPGSDKECAARLRVQGTFTVTTKPVVPFAPQPVFVTP